MISNISYWLNFNSLDCNWDDFDIIYDIKYVENYTHSVKFN